MAETFERSRIEALVAAAVAELAAEVGQEFAGGAAPVFGAPGAVLDSMGLVNLIADLEARIELETGRSVLLADERAMSRSRSPFRSVESIAELILCQLQAS